METINLEQLKSSFRGRPFYQLIEYHLKKQNTRKLQKAVLETMELLPQEVKHLAEGFIDTWNEQVYNKEFWSKDTSEIFTMIIEDAREVLHEENIPVDDETLFNMFQIVVLSFAYSASNQPKMQEFIGITSVKKSFPIVSAISLIYPISASLYMLTRGANFYQTIGYGLSNLGYLLFVAGIISGTFRIFKLTKRLHVFTLSIIVWLLGTILINLS